ncbi:hypothetical protein SEUCBS139899_002939 [Sporothrix eucalyptigena]|uniref:Alternative oxidase n=1 Tax=Sporothrix eucalyptigena TaxID=1812306 RepID=A0ABP0CWM8_9PEZI
MFSRRSGLVTSLFLALIFVWSIRLLPWHDYPNYSTATDAWNSAKETITGKIGGSKTPNTKHIQDYFDSSFALEEPRIFPFPEIRAACAAADWEQNEAYINCVAITAGMTSIMSQVKVCFKMAIETGSHLMLPTMPLRDSKDLLNFNFFNGDAYMPYDQWYDADHLRRQMAEACPKMKIIHPDDIKPEKGGTIAVRRKFEVLCSNAYGYHKFHSYFWVGRPYKTYFNQQFFLNMMKLQEEEAAKETPVEDNGGITLVDVDSEFLLFRITDDPTRRDLRLWTELSHLIRFRDDVRTVIDRLVQRLPNAGNYMGVHFRAENDTIWSSAKDQMAVDLDALDKAWEMFGNYGEEKPPVYLACGDQKQIEMFTEAAAERGWKTMHKWELAKLNGDTETAGMIDKMAFDFQGAIDLGLMVRSRFFLGIQGSAFSSTVGNHRDVTGRYRGSSFDIPDDGARTHLFNDNDAVEYACCL